MIRKIREKAKEFKLYNQLIRIPFNGASSNLHHEEKFAFIHVPKTGGSSIRKALGLLGPGDHRLPVHMMHPQTWETYFTFCFVRNPWDRLVSSYNYHMSPRYAAKNGVLLRRNPKLQKMRFEDYFHRYKNNVNLKPQITFTSHLLSEQPIDFVGRFENISQDFNKVLSMLETRTRLPYENASSRKVNYRDFFTPGFKNEVGDFYEGDLQKFNYSF